MPATVRIKYKCPVDVYQRLEDRDNAMVVVTEEGARLWLDLRRYPEARGHSMEKLFQLLRVTRTNAGSNTYVNLLFVQSMVDIYGDKDRVCELGYMR